MNPKKAGRSTRRSMVLCAVFLACFVLSGCAHVISAKLRKEVNKDLSFPTVLGDPEAFKGQTVIWGGVIYKTNVTPERTEIIVIETPFDRWERPEGAGHARGRFIARTSGYLDPQIYRAGRDITVAGEIIGTERRPLNEVEEYIYPVVEIREMHLWKRMPDSPAYYWWRWGWYREPGNLYYEEPRDLYNEFWNWE